MDALKLTITCYNKQFVRTPFSIQIKTVKKLKFSFQVSRVLHSRLVHRWQEADLPLLSREGGPEENVPDSVGEASHHVRTAARLAQVAGLLAADHPHDCSSHQLGPRSRIGRRRRRSKSQFMKNVIFCFVV